MKNMPKEPKKPKAPLCRIIREGSGKYCPKCGSTYLTKYKFFLFRYKKGSRLYTI